MKESQLPLFELFRELQRPLRLGLDQYGLLLEALEKGFGYEGFDDLKTLCQVLWLKSRFSDEEKSFEEIFENFRKRYSKPSRTQPTPEEGEDIGKKLKTDSPPGESTTTPAPIAPPPKRLTTTQTLPPSQFRLPAAYEVPPPIDITLSEKGYILKMSEFPFIDRAMRQKWRQLRQRVQNGFTDKPDIPKTLNIISRERICLAPPCLPRWENQLRLLFLEDIEGSMKPFRPIVQELFNTIEPNRFQQVERYYFRNCIGTFVYTKPKGAEIRTLDELVLKSNATVAIIVSDAGAARGGYNQQRIDLTKNFLEYLQPRIKSLIWLNPVPWERWRGTSSEAIAEGVNQNMFEFSQNDLNRAIRCAKRGSGG